MIFCIWFLSIYANVFRSHLWFGTYQNSFRLILEHSSGHALLCATLILSLANLLITQEAITLEMHFRFA